MSLSCLLWCSYVKETPSRSYRCPISTSLLIRSWQSFSADLSRMWRFLHFVIKPVLLYISSSSSSSSISSFFLSSYTAAIIYIQYYFIFIFMSSFFIIYSYYLIVIIIKVFFFSFFFLPLLFFFLLLFILLCHNKHIAEIVRTGCCNTSVYEIVKAIGSEIRC